MQHLKMAKQFKEMGHQVFIFSFDHFFISRNLFYNYLLVYKNLQNTIRKFKPEIILTSDPYFTTFLSLLTKLKSSKLILRTGAIYHRFYSARISEIIASDQIYNRFFTFLNSFLEKIDIHILKRCNFIIFNSKFLRDYYKNSSKNSCVIYNGIEYHTTKEPQFVEPLKLVYVGRIEPRKSIELIIDALYLVKKRKINFQFSLIGSTSQFPKYWVKLQEKIMAFDLRNNVTILGEVNNKELFPILEKHDILLFSTDDRNFPITEGLPNAILEGMASGLAIISTSIAGVPELLDASNGFIVHPNPLDFSKKIEFLSKNPTVLLKMKAKNIDKVSRNFSIQKTTKLYLKIFRMLMLR